MIVQLSDDSIPLKRPHFQLREGQLFFLLSGTAHADFGPGDAALWNRIDGTRTVGQLREYGPEVESRLQRFWELGACELAPARFSADRRRVLVIEPHMDDAVLSIGGLMWSLRNECEFTVVSVTGCSNYTRYFGLGREFFGEFFDVAQVSELRKAESEIVMRILGGKHVTLGKVDAPLRYQPGNWTLDWYQRHKEPVGEFLNHCSSQQEIEFWATGIEQLLRDTDAHEIWLPLGVGNHTDHELTRDAWLRALASLSDFEHRVALFLYQDIPYANRYPSHTSQILDALTAAGAVLEQQQADVTGALAAKLRLSSVFESQFDMAYMAPEIEAAARRASPSGTGCSELHFKVKNLPGAIAPLAVYSGKASVQDLVAKLQSWYPRHRHAKRIRVISPGAIGRWVSDLSFLLATFPQATLEVHISLKCAAEAEALVSPRLEIRTVSGRAHGWLVRLLQIALGRKCPVIVLTGEKQQSGAWIVKATSFLSDRLPATSTNHLVLALTALMNSCQQEFLSGDGQG